MISSRVPVTLHTLEYWLRMPESSQRTLGKPSAGGTPGRISFMMILHGALRPNKRLGCGAENAPSTPTLGIRMGKIPRATDSRHELTGQRRKITSQFVTDGRPILT